MAEYRVGAWLNLVVFSYAPGTYLTVEQAPRQTLHHVDVDRIRNVAAGTLKVGRKLILLLSGRGNCAFS
jgi:hypothetical protein